MQVERHHPVGAGMGDQVCDQLGGDRRSGAGFAVLPGISEIRHHRRDPARRRAAQRVDDDQQLHQVIVGRERRALDHEDVRAAHVFLDFHEDFHIGKAAHHRLGDRQFQVIADFGRKRRIGIPGDELDRSVFRHPSPRWLSLTRDLLARRTDTGGDPVPQYGGICSP
jgi:hypothetical protein